MSGELRDTPVAYVRHGWLLVPIPSGSKGPRHKNWNKRERCVTDAAAAAALRGNIGLAHAYAGTCCIDLDNLDRARPWFAEREIDLDSLLNAQDAVRISSGRPNRAKLLYRLDSPLPSLKLADGALEFRCATSDGATVQDVLPPSRHPSGGTYRWEYPEPLVGHWSTSPALPVPLFTLWNSLLSPCQSTVQVTGRAALQPASSAGRNPGAISEGSRNSFLTSEAGRLQRIGLDPSAISAALHALNSSRCRPPLPEPEVEAIVRSILRYPPEHRTKPEARPIRLLSATDISPEPISWLWTGWLARGKLQILAGAPGCGKTTIALKFAATITTGGAWPDGSRAPVCNVLIWSGEDDPRDTLLPRLLAMGANPHRIFFVGGRCDSDGHAYPFDPAQDMESLHAEAMKLGDVGFIVVDPIVNAVAGDSHKNSETRRSLQPIVDLAEQLGAAVLGISHYTKGTQGRDPIERVTGSIAFGAVPRIIMGAAKVQREDGGLERILVRAKSNIGPDGGGYGYSLEQVELKEHAGLCASVVLWESPLDGSAQKLLSNAEAAAGGGVGGGALEEAENFLRVELADGPVSSRELAARGKNAGLANRTVKRAKQALGVKAHRDGATGTWYCCLPEEFEDLGQEGQNGPRQKDGPLGPLGTTSLGIDSFEQRGQECQGGQGFGVAALVSGTPDDV